MSKEKLKQFIFERPLRINKMEDHRMIVKRGFIAASIYSIIYGFYEYFIVYNYIRLYDIIGSSINWSIMYIALIATVAFATRYNDKFNIEQVIMGLFFMAMFEDVIFWLSQWIDLAKYPFPTGNWWDNTFASFRVLGGLGLPVPFWPFFPTYYIPGFAMVIVFYICSFKSPNLSRVAFYIIGPLFIAVLLGALGNEIFAIFVLITIPLVVYIFIIVLLSKSNWKFIQN